MSILYTFDQTDLFFCYMLYAQNLSNILHTQKGVYIIFEYKTNFEREAFRFGRLYLIKHTEPKKHSEPNQITRFFKFFCISKPCQVMPKMFWTMPKK